MAVLPNEEMTLLIDARVVLFTRPRMVNVCWL